jgi:ferrous iron transport protein B
MVSDRIDRIATHKYLAVPLFLLAMLIVFSITFGPLGSLLSESMGLIMEKYIGMWVFRALKVLGATDWLVSLCVDGIIAGVGGVLSFLPQIALLFLFLSFMEDCGYMARAAFIMDRLLKRIGLSGKAFIPMLMGFGCSVPAIMGARTMESEKDRRMTIMLVPFMSCSAKLPVYGLISAAFFGKNAGVAVFSLYVLGILMAIASGLIFRKTIFKGETAVFVMELPPYRLPTLGNTLQHVGERVRDFLVRAGTLILLMSIVLWFLQSFDTGFNMVEDPSDSILGFLGGLIAPVFVPMGYGTWQAAVALLTGLVAKEAVVASLSMFYGFNLTAESAVIAAALGSTFSSPLAAFSFLVFILLYVPCVAAISAAHKELGGLKWTLALVGWQIVVAYAASLLVYRIGSLMGLA